MNKEGLYEKLNIKGNNNLKYLLPLKREWFIGRENVDVLNVDNLNPDEVGKKVKEWVDYCIEKY